MPVKIDISPQRIQVKVDTAFKNGLEKLSTEILADCNQKAKRRDGALILSSWIHSQLDKGLLIWQTPYAKKQYWEIETAIKEKNPEATWKWCEAAEQENKAKWNSLAQKAFEENL